MYEIERFPGEISRSDRGKSQWKKRNDSRIVLHQHAGSKASVFMNFHRKAPSDGLLLTTITCFSSSADMYPLPSLSNTLNAFLNSSSIVMLACLAAINWRNSLKSISPLPAENKLFNSFQKSKDLILEENWTTNAQQSRNHCRRWVMPFGEAMKIQYSYIVFVNAVIVVSVGEKSEVERKFHHNPDDSHHYYLI